MAEVTDTVLKTYFETGDIPTQAQFASLIDSKVSRVATLTALKALTAPDFARMVYLSGRATAGDGGEGVFVWSSSDLSTEVAADTLSGIYVKADDTAATSGAWVRQVTGSCDIRWWGAGTAASAATNAAAISAAVASGYSVYIPP